jgi:hypothetical protein
MPFGHLILLLACVLLAAGISVWLLSMGGAGLMVAALPAFLIAAAAWRVLRK